MDEERRAKLEATTRWDPAEAETRIFAAWEASGAFDPPAEGRVVRGFDGMDVGERVRVRLVQTDVARGFIDFVRA